MSPGPKGAAPFDSQAHQQRGERVTGVGTLGTLEFDRAQLCRSQAAPGAALRRDESVTESKPELRLPLRHIGGSSDHGASGGPALGKNTCCAFNVRFLGVSRLRVTAFLLLSCFLVFFALSVPVPQPQTHITSFLRFSAFSFVFFSL